MRAPFLALHEDKGLFWHAHQSLPNYSSDAGYSVQPCIDNPDKVLLFKSVLKLCPGYLQKSAQG